MFRCCWCTGSSRSRGCCYTVEVEASTHMSAPQCWLASWQSPNRGCWWLAWWLCMKTTRFSWNRLITYSRCVLGDERWHDLIYLSHDRCSHDRVCVYVCRNWAVRIACRWISGRRCSWPPHRTPSFRNSCSDCRPSTSTGWQSRPQIHTQTICTHVQDASR